MATADMMIFGNLLNSNMLFKMTAVLLLIFTAGAMALLRLERQNNVYYEIIKSDNLNQREGWGYEIYMNDDLYIRQTEIPCIQGEQAFHTYIDAERIAKKVTDKIIGNALPVITKTDLIEANILIE